MTDDYDSDEFLRKAPPEFHNLDDPKYKITIDGKTVRIAKRHIIINKSGCKFLKIYCINRCCSTILPILNKSIKSVFQSDKFRNLQCEVFNDDGTFKQSFIEESKQKKEDPLNDPKLSKSEKFAYVDSLGWEEDVTELLKDSIDYEDSM